jgi:quercetin dioxygenase-like cupin family protein
MSTTIPTAPTILVRSPEMVAPLHLFGQQAFPLVTADDTAEAFSLLLYVAAPGDGPPPHRHRTNDETFITVDPGFEFLADNAWRAVPPHTVVHIPAGARHTFRNASNAPARTWVLTIPGIIDRFLAALADISADAARTGNAPDTARVAAVYDAYGVEPLP